MVLADPGCIEASVKQEVLINRNSVLFSVRPPGELGSREVFCFVLFCFFGDRVLLCRSGWSASGAITAFLASWAQAILLPQPPE